MLKRKKREVSIGGGEGEGKTESEKKVFCDFQGFQGLGPLLGPAKSLATKTIALKPTFTAARKSKAKLELRLTTSTKPTGILKVTPVSPIISEFLGTPESSIPDPARESLGHCPDTAPSETFPNSRFAQATTCSNCWRLMASRWQI